MVWERFDGATRELDWGELQDLANQAAHLLRDARRREGRSRRRRPPSHRRDRGDLLRHLEARRDPALDVGALRRRRHPPPARRRDARRCWSPTPPTPPASTPRWSSDDPGPRRRRLLAGQPTDHICEDTSADDPAQLYYTSGTTGKAKGIVHAHRYILAHEEFVYCHDIRDGERFHGMGEWAWAAGISPLLGPWRLGAVQYVLQREAGFVPADQLDFLSRHEVTNVFTTPTAMRAMMAIDGRGRALPAEVPDRLLGRRAAQPRGDPLVPRPVRRHRPRLLRPHRVLSAVRELPVHGGARGVDGQADARLGRPDPRRGRAARSRRASAARSACAPARTRTTRSATGTCPRPPRRPSAATGSTPRTRRRWTRTATSGTPGRADDVIIAAGYRIGPFEVESACIEHPAVREAAAVASPDEVKGNVVKAFIVLAEGHEPSDELAEEIKTLRPRAAQRLRVPAQGRVRRRAAEDAHRQDPPDRVARGRARARAAHRLAP